MQQITNINDSPKQTLEISIPEGNVASLTLKYDVVMSCIKCDFNYAQVNTLLPDVTFNNFIITQNLNFLSRYSNIIPFGIAVLSSVQYEPNSQDDFSSGRFKMYLLSKDELTV